MSRFYGRIVHEHRDMSPTLKIRCVTHKFGNFTDQQIYYAIGRQLGTKPTGIYTQYQFADNDGDTYTLDARDIGTKFIIIDRL